MRFTPLILFPVIPRKAASPQRLTQSESAGYKFVLQTIQDSPEKLAFEQKTGVCVQSRSPREWIILDPGKS
jgi:hypothetical protein